MEGADDLDLAYEAMVEAPAPQVLLGFVGLSGFGFWVFWGLKNNASSYSMGLLLASALQGPTPPRANYSSESQLNKRSCLVPSCYFEPQSM